MFTIPLAAMRHIFLVLFAGAVLSCGSNTSEQIANEESPVSVLNSNNPNDILNIAWQAGRNTNPFNTPPIRYEIWHNDTLLDTVSQSRYQLRLSELSTDRGCISIRAVRGNDRSDPSSPACFVIRS